jgi:hypothetical protein
MEDVMFFHKSKPLAAGFACAAAAMIIGFTANPAQADRRNYCDKPECKYPVGGIVQKEREGVNYFYGGGIHEPSPSLSYIYVINRNLDQPHEEPIRSPSLFTSSFEAPLFRNRFRLNKDNRRMHRRFGHSLEFPVGVHSGDKFMAP